MNPMDAALKARRGRSITLEVTLSPEGGLEDVKEVGAEAPLEAESPPMEMDSVDQEVVGGMEDDEKNRLMNSEPKGFMDRAKQGALKRMKK